MNAKKLSVITLLLIILSALTIVHAAAVIAIDLGSEFIKVGIRKSGSPIDVVLNEQSKRKTPAMIGFRGKDRYFGESAKSMSTRFPGHIFRFLTLLSGKQYTKNSDLFKRYQQDYFLPYKLLRNRDRNGTIDVLPVDESSRYTPEELLAMILQYLKGLATSSAGAPVTDAVITIPPFFNFEQRQAILDAAALADINVLALQHSTTAAALQYGITKYKTVKELEQGKSMNVVIVDMGSTSVKVSAVAFHGPRPNTDELGQLSVKAVSWDDTVGGNDLDARLVKYFLSEFKKKYGKDISDNNRVTARLFAEAKKHKEILSANEKTLVIIEALADDKDLKLEITREQFVEMIKDLIEKVVATVDRTIKNSGLKSDDIEAVEIIGGGARVPAIQNELKNSLKKSLSFSLNSDEAIATGAAYYAATLTTFFNAKSFALNDIFPYQVDFTLSSQEKEKTFTLLKEFEELTARKSVNIPRKEDFTIALKYNKEQYEGIPSFAEYDVKGVEAAIANLSSSETSDKPKVRLTFRLSGSGMLDLESAIAQAEVITMVPEEEKKESKKDDKKEDKKTEEKKEDDKKTDDKKDEKTEEKKEEKTEEKKEVKYKQEKKLVKINLSTTARQTTLRSLTKDQKAVTKEKLAELAEYDRIKQTIAKNRNDLEGYIYTTRAKLLDEPENEFKQYYTEEQIQKLNQLATESDDWLSSDAQDFEEKTDAKVVIETYANKIKALKDIAESIYKRKTDREEREKAVEKCKQGLTTTSSLVQNLKNETHITPEEIEGVLKSIEDVEAWLAENLAKQAKVPFNEPSIVYADDVNSKCFVPAQKAMKLLQKPKPKPKPEVKIEAQNTTTEAKPEATQEQKPAEEAKPDQEAPKEEGEKKSKDEL